MTKKRCSALFLGAAMSAMVMFFGVGGCNDNDDAVVTTTADCSTVCNRYRTCFNQSFDVTTCTNRCQTALTNRTIVSTDIDDCRNCMGANACTPAYSCADACDLVIVVP